MTRLLIVSLVWAFSFGLIKRYLTGIDSSVVACLRIAFAFVVFLPFLRLRSVGSRAALRLAAIGALQFGVMYMSYIAAFRTLGAYEIAVLTILTPFWVCIFDDLFSRQFTGRAYLAAAVAVAGTAVIIVTKRPEGSPVEGFLLVQVSNACFALGQVLYRRWRAGTPTKVRDRDVFAWLYGGGIVATLPFAIPSAAETLPSLGGAQWSVLAYLGILASGVCFFLWNTGATRVSAATLAVMNNLKVPLAVACSLLFFGESTDPVRLLIGGGLIGLALWVARDRKGVA